MATCQKRIQWTIGLGEVGETEWRFWEADDTCTTVGEDTFVHVQSWCPNFIQLVYNEAKQKHGCSLSRNAGWQELIKARNAEQCKVLSTVANAEDGFMRTKRAKSLPIRSSKRRRSDRERPSPTLLHVALPPHDDFGGGEIITLAPQTATEPFALRVNAADVALVVGFIRAHGEERESRPYTRKDLESDHDGDGDAQGVVVEPHGFE